LEVLGVLFTKFDGRLNLHRRALETIDAMRGMMSSPGVELL
jgi:hypothetical protein